MISVRSTDELRAAVSDWRAGGRRIGLVPTMGALHEGHLALVRRAGELADRVVTSVFVNPTQFGPQEDFDAYPRDLEGDATLLAAAGCDLLFAPDRSTVYPDGHCTFVEPAGPARGLEDDQRPGHFRGVATVVTQLFNMVQPDLAVFGEKDAQQLAVVRRLVRDLHLPVEIVSHPTVREADGLALSSRNAYLSPAERRAAGVIHRALTAAREAIDTGERSAEAIRRLLRSVLASEPTFRLDYAEVVDAESFRPIRDLAGEVVLPVAGRLGPTRLLDNLRLDLSRSASTPTAQMPTPLAMKGTR